MSAVKTISCLLLGLALCVGCNKHQETVSTPPADDVASTKVQPDQGNAKTTKPSEPLAAEDGHTDVASDSQNPDSKNTVAGKPSADDASDATLVSKQFETESAAPVSPPAPPEPRRLIILGSRAPVVVDLFVMQGERALDEVALESAREMLASADEDEDGSTDWEEIAGYSGMTGRGGDMMGGLARGRLRGQQFRAYDANANGEVDEAELIRFYNRGQASIDWLVMRTTLDVATTDIAAPLGRWLDSNRNGKLETTEIDSAAARLMMKDGNDDGVLQPSEFQQTSQAMQLAFNAQQPISENAIPAFFVTEDAEWSELLYRIQRKYTFGAPLLSDDTERWTAAFHDLDEDGDGTIWDHELALVAKRPADLNVTFRFPSVDDYRAAYANQDEAQDGAQESVNSSILGSVQVMPASGKEQQTGTAVPIETSAGTLIFAVANSYLSGPYAEQLELGFDRLDGDDDDALNESEFTFLAQALQLSFDAIDADDDDKVTREELELGLSPATKLATMRVELWMLPQDDPIFTALDQNHDGHLDTVEIESCAERLLELDVDQDGMVQSSETDFGMFVVLRNAPPGNVFPPPSPAQITRAADADVEAPTWFSATDANRDGTIGRQEFLGDMELFDQLDVDHNGSLSLTEATSE